MNEQDPVVYNVYVGIDWADKKHDVCICPKETLNRATWEAASGTHRLSNFYDGLQKMTQLKAFGDSKFKPG